MTRFFDATMTDLRRGRQTWRVLLLLAIPSVAASIVASLLTA